MTATKPPCMASLAPSAGEPAEACSASHCRRCTAAAQAIFAAEAEALVPNRSAMPIAFSGGVSHLRRRVTASRPPGGAGHPQGDYASEPPMSF